MAELEYRIGVTFMYPDGRRESITVSRRGNDEESSRHAVWHEYKNRFPEVSQVCLITNLIGINLPSENTAADDLNSENLKQQLPIFPRMPQGVRPPESQKNPRL